LYRGVVLAVVVMIVKGKGRNTEKNPEPLLIVYMYNKESTIQYHEVIYGVEGSPCCCILSPYFEVPKL
jgi:hypothetical protein